MSPANEADMTIGIQLTAPFSRSASTIVGFVVPGVPALVPPAVGFQLSSLAFCSVFWLQGEGGYLHAAEFLAFGGMLFSAFLGVLGLADINLSALIPKRVGLTFIGHELLLLFTSRVVVGDENSRVPSTAQ